MAGPRGSAVSNMTKNTLKIIHSLAPHKSPSDTISLGPERILAQRPHSFYVSTFLLKSKQGSFKGHSFLEVSPKISAAGY